MDKIFVLKSLIIRMLLFCVARLTNEAKMSTLGEENDIQDIEVPLNGHYPRNK